MYGWIKTSLEGHEFRYRKEIFPIEAGWEKGGKSLPFTKEFADTVVSESNRRLGNGVKIPLTLSHKGQEPYGQVVSLERAANDRGSDSIFMLVDFQDAEAERSGLSNEVSVFIPPKSIDGKGVSYSRALEHVALTPYPVVHGMDNWQPIAASLTTTNESDTMDLSKLAKKLNVTLGDDEAVNLDALLEGIDTISASIKPDPDPKPDVEPVKIPKLVLDEVLASRELQLDRLVETGKIDPATRDTMSKEFCDSEVLSLSLSADETDSFSFMIKTLSANAPVALASSHEEIELALHTKEGEDSPVVAAAKRAAGIK